MRKYIMSFGRNIHQQRKANNLSIFQISKLSKINLIRYKQIELGWGNAKIDELSRIAETLNLTLHDMFSFDL